MLGANLMSVQKLLGHSDPKITERRNGHLLPDFMRAEVNRLRFGPGVLLPAPSPRPSPPHSGGEGDQQASAAAGAPRVTPGLHSGPATKEEARTPRISPSDSGLVTGGVYGTRTRGLRRDSLTTVTSRSWTTFAIRGKHWKRTFAEWPRLVAFRRASPAVWYPLGIRWTVRRCARTVTHRTGACEDPQGEPVHGLPGSGRWPGAAREGEQHDSDCRSLWSDTDRVDCYPNLYEGFHPELGTDSGRELSPDSLSVPLTDRRYGPWLRRYYG
jgi:hypothetical protein